MIHRQKVDEHGRVAQSGNRVISDPTEKLHDKIRKILALTQSGNESEAQMAAAKLQSLLDEHNLSMADLEQKGQDSPGIRQESHDLGKAAFKWKLDLAEGISEFYYCASIVNRYSKQVAFVGRPDNVESLKMLYGWVIEQIKEIAKLERRVHFYSTGQHIDPLRWQVAFGEGAVERLIDRLREMKSRQLEDMSRDSVGNVTALAIHHKGEVSDYLESKYGYRMDGKETKWQRERREQAEALEVKREELFAECEKAGDMEPYYDEYPWERPDTEEEKAKQEKENAEWMKKKARNAKRRTGRWSSGPAIDWDKEDQAGKAKAAGRASAGKINLQPFLGTGNAGKSKGALK